MENKIIINEKIAEVFLEILAQDSIKHILNPEFIINKNCICNRAIINALFSILKDTLNDNNFYEICINKLVFSKYKYYQFPINKISNEKLIIDLNLCIDNYKVIIKYFDQVIECDEFYRIVNEELDNFYNKRKSYTQQPIHDDIFNKIPLFGNNGEPMNEAANNFIKAIDRRIEIDNYERMKAHKAK